MDETIKIDRFEIIRAEHNNGAYICIDGVKSELLMVKIWSLPKARPLIIEVEHYKQPYEEDVPNGTMKTEVTRYSIGGEEYEKNRLKEKEEDNRSYEEYKRNKPC